MAEPVARPAVRARRRIALAGLALASVAGLTVPQVVEARPPVVSAAFPPLTASAIYGYRNNIAVTTNNYRAQAGLRKLTVSGALTNACQAHANDMAKMRRMTHIGSDGSNGGVRARRHGFLWTSWGENVAYGYTSSGDVMRAWMNSASHRANIMNRSFTFIGVGVQRATNGTLYYCMLLGY